MEDLPCSGRPLTSSTEVNIVKVKEMMTENRHLSLREIAAELSMYHESIRTILNDCLGMKCVVARLFSLSKTQINTSRHLFSVDRTHKRKFTARTKVDSRKCV